MFMLLYILSETCENDLTVLAAVHFTKKVYPTIIKSYFYYKNIKNNETI